MTTRLRDFGILFGVCVWCVCAECFLAVCQCKCVPNVTWQRVSVSVCVCVREVTKILRYKSPQEGGQDSKSSGA